MTMTVLDLGGRRCHLFAQDSPQCLLIQLLGSHEQDSVAAEAAIIAAKSSCPIAMAALEINDWQRELMPWDTAAAKGAQAQETLRLLLEVLLPQQESHFGKLPVVLGGYSLAGLFALWAARETNAFSGVAAASPSVWIDGWPDYTERHPMQAQQVYLSLGKREEHTRNRLFAQVGNRIRAEHALLQNQLGDSHCTLEWNSGGHFVDCDLRLANAFIWNLNRLTAN